MPRQIDQSYLKNQQYRSADNLEARIALHRDFGTNPYDWQLWVFDQLSLEPGMHILEMGCGPASLWRVNLHRLPAGADFILGDLSIGMVRQARLNLSNQTPFTYLTGDAQSLPLPAAHFDRVIANHMLYHVPDIIAAAREFKRVLKPGGPLFAATNGNEHMAELHQLFNEFEPGHTLDVREIHRFSLENAPQNLGQVFSQVEVIPFESHLKVTDPSALVAYITSIWDGLDSSNPQRLQAFERFMRSRFEPGGYFWITKSQGLVIARD